MLLKITTGIWNIWNKVAFPVPFFSEQIHRAWIMSDMAASETPANLELPLALLNLFANKIKAGRKTET